MASHQPTVAPSDERPEKPHPNPPPLPFPRVPALRAESSPECPAAGLLSPSALRSPESAAPPRTRALHESLHPPVETPTPRKRSTATTAGVAPPSPVPKSQSSSGRPKPAVPDQPPQRFDELPEST